MNKFNKKLAEAAEKGKELTSKEETSQDLYIPIENIKPGNNPRKNFDPEKMEDLKVSIQEQGLIQPIIVRRLDTNEYEIIAGERRYRAHKELGLDKIQAVVKADEELADVALNALAENMVRDDLTPIEEALAFKELIDLHGLTHEKIGQKFRKSREAISNKIGLLNLSQNIQDVLNDGSLKEGHAKVIKGLNKGVTDEDIKAQEDLTMFVISQGLSVRNLEAYVKQVKAKKISIGEPMIIEVPKVEVTKTETPNIEVSKTETIQDSTVPQGTQEIKMDMAEANQDGDISDDDIIAMSGGQAPAATMTIPENIDTTPKSMPASEIADPLEAFVATLKEMLPLDDFKIDIAYENNEIMLTLESAEDTDASEVMGELFKA